MDNVIKFILNDSTEILFVRDEVLTHTQFINQKEQVFRGGEYGNAIFRYGKEKTIYSITFINRMGTMEKLEQLYNESEAMVLYYELLINTESKETVKMLKQGMQWAYDLAYKVGDNTITLQFYKTLADQLQFSIIDVNKDIIKI